MIVTVLVMLLCTPVKVKVAGEAVILTPPGVTMLWTPVKVSVPGVTVMVWGEPPALGTSSSIHDTCPAILGVPALWKASKRITKSV